VVGGRLLRRQRNRPRRAGEGRISITIDPEAAEVTFDFSDSAEQQRGPMNAPIIPRFPVPG